MGPFVTICDPIVGLCDTVALQGPLERERAFVTRSSGFSGLRGPIGVYWQAGDPYSLIGILVV